MNFIVTPQAQARLSEHVAYGPVTPDSWQYIDAERAARLPSTPQRLEQSVFLDIAWWADNEAAVAERYTALLQR